MQMIPVRTGAESQQPVGAPIYLFVGCRDDAGHFELVGSVGTRVNMDRLESICRKRFTVVFFKAQNKTFLT